MIRAFKRLAVTLALLFFMSGCQAMTGQTVGESMDDSMITSSVKTQLASDKLVTLTRVEVEKCEFNGQQLRFITGRTRDRAGSRKLARLTFLPLPAGTYENRIPREITKLLIP